MNDNKIIVPVDFTDAADSAIELASVFADKTGLGITLLHIHDEKIAAEPEDDLQVQAKRLAEDRGLASEFRIRKGNIFKEIPNAAEEEDYKLMIVGTHGFKGIREKFFGSDILKLVKNIPVPVIVIRKDYRIPPAGIRTIVFPAGTHKAFTNNIGATIFIAKLFDAEVHIYSVEKPGQEWSPELKANIELARSEFEKHGVRYKRVNEKQTTYSMGFAKQILKYAQSVSADLIAVMSIPTPEHYYFADSDKEMLLVNDEGIPILCTNDKKVV